MLAVLELQCAGNQQADLIVNTQQQTRILSEPVKTQTGITLGLGAGTLIRMVQQPFRLQRLVIAGKPADKGQKKTAVILMHGGGKIQIVEPTEITRKLYFAFPVGVLDASDFPKDAP